METFYFMETWGRGDGETRRLGDGETRRRGDWDADETDSLMRSAGVGGFFRNT